MTPAKFRIDPAARGDSEDEFRNEADGVELEAEPHMPPTDEDGPPEPERPFCHFRGWDSHAWLLFGLFLLATTFALTTARALLIPVAVGAIVGFVLNPLVRRMHRLRLPDWVSAALVLAGLLAVVAALLFGLSAPATAWMKDAPEHLYKIELQMRSWLRGSVMQNFGEATERIGNIADLGGGAKEVVVEVRTEQPSLSSYVVEWTSSFLLGASVAIVLAYFLLAAREQTKRNMLALCRDFRGRRGMVQMAMEIEKSISLYLATVTVINICLGIAIGTTMWWIGMPNPVLWGAMAALLNYAPYIGPIVGIVIVGGVSLLTFEGSWYAVLAPLGYAAWNSLEGQFLTPAIVGRWMQMSPLAILLSILYWGFVWGPGGVLLAVPLLAVGLIVFRHLRDFVPPPEEDAANNHGPRTEWHSNPEPAEQPVVI